MPANHERLRGWALLEGALMESRVALLMIPHLFLLIAAVLVAPHLAWPSARCFALASLGFAPLFWLVISLTGPR